MLRWVEAFFFFFFFVCFVFFCLFCYIFFLSEAQTSDEEQCCVLGWTFCWALPLLWGSHSCCRGEKKKKCDYYFIFFFFGHIHLQQSKLQKKWRWAFVRLLPRHRHRRARGHRLLWHVSPGSHCLLCDRADHEAAHKSVAFLESKKIGGNIERKEWAE